LRQPVGAGIQEGEQVIGVDLSSEPRGELVGAAGAQGVGEVGKRLAGVEEGDGLGRQGIHVEVLGKGGWPHMSGARGVGERDAKAVTKGGGNRGRSRLGAGKIRVQEEGGKWRGVGRVVAKVSEGLWEGSRGSEEWGSVGRFGRREGK
jgi:hypothetical protein